MNCFSPERRQRLGLEVEWLVHRTTHPGAHIDLPEIEGRLARLPPSVLHGRVTIEPGGQVEVASHAHEDPAHVVRATEADTSIVEAGLAAAGLRLVGQGLDPGRPARRVLAEPRYDAMEHYFVAGDSCTDRTAGRSMMCRTASVQVNLDLGASRTMSERWRLLETVGPALAAAFSNSPLTDGRPCGHRSGRLATWHGLDRSRTTPPRPTGDPATTWTDYALDARVMLIRDGDRYVPVTRPLRFGDWLTGGHELGYPGEDDLAYHLTTLFPPVRPRGWFEIRYVDTLPHPWWTVPGVVLAALCYDPRAAAAATGRVALLGSCWTEAARDGMTSEPLRDAAVDLLDLAIDAGKRLGYDGELLELVDAYASRWPRKGRSPADDLLDRWARGEDPARPLRELEGLLA